MISGARDSELVVADLMTLEPVVVQVTAGIEEAEALMHAKHQPGMEVQHEEGQRRPGAKCHGRRPQARREEADDADRRQHERSECHCGQRQPEHPQQFRGDADT